MSHVEPSPANVGVPYQPYPNQTTTWKTKIYNCICGIYCCIRGCCCICGCLCTFGWISLIYFLVALSIDAMDTDWTTLENTCYHTLNVTPEATPKEIQRSFRKLALQYHPDKVPFNQQQEAEEIFKEISHCYEILSDPKKRKKYDASGYSEDPFPGFHANFDFQDFMQEFSDMFNNKHDTKPQKEKPQRKSNREYATKTPNSNKAKNKKREKKPKRRRQSEL